MRAPRVSVVIATYDWSSVLRHSIASVLGQTFDDFEVLVVGDGCTDDSADVTASFGDRRVRWDNLERNSGNQSAPNNRGLELARGDLVAYLGHDDLWHRDHLEVLVHAIDASRADLVHSVAQIVGPPGSNDRRLFGLTPGEEHPPRLFAPPSAVLHRAELARSIGGWRDYRTIRLPPDFEFLRRAWEHGRRLVSVNELTVFKFPSGLRRDSYREKRDDEQAETARRMREEPEFRYRELMETLRSLASRHPELVSETWIPEDVEPGAIVESLRAVRGLPPGDLPSSSSIATEVTARPFWEDPVVLRRFNRRDDVSPLRFRQALHLCDETPPQDGLFLGRGWHDPERDEWGLGYRWGAEAPELVLTRPTANRGKIWLEMFTGPGAGNDPLGLSVLDESGTQVAHTELQGRKRVELAWPVPSGRGAVIRIVPAGGGLRISSDPRVLDFALAAFDWV